MAPILIFSTLSQFLCSVLHASGNIMTPFKYITVCNLIKIGLTFFLITMPLFNILGAIIASFLANVIYFILNFAKIRKDFGITAITFTDFGKVLISSFIMVAVSYLFLGPVTSFIHNVFISFLIAIVLGFLAYVLALILLGALKKEEITHFHG